jgi:PilZ domain
MPVVKDRRSSLRVLIEGKALVQTERDQFEGWCVDLGLDGIAIRSTRAARSRERVTLELLVHGQWLGLPAVLARRQRIGGEYLMGLRLVALDLDMRRHIEHLVFERLEGSPQAAFMRAFVAHAERVPPLGEGHGGPIEHTVVAAAHPVPVISGHTQIVSIAHLSSGDRTVIAPPPPRSDTLPSGAEPAHMPPAVMAPVVSTDAWFEDEMDTAKLRLLEAELGPADATDEPEPTVVTGDADERLVERTTLLFGDAAPAPIERTEVFFGDAAPSPTERTAVFSDATPLPVPLLHTATLALGFAIDPDLPPFGDGERTVPLLRGSLPPPPTTTPRSHAAPALRPTLRAVQDATNLLRGPDPTRRRGPRVIVSLPDRTHRRSAPEPWNR